MPPLIMRAYFFFNDPPTTQIYTLSLHDALPISRPPGSTAARARRPPRSPTSPTRSEEHTSELQSRRDLVCRLLLEKKKDGTKHCGTFILKANNNLKP